MPSTTIACTPCRRNQAQHRSVEDAAQDEEMFGEGEGTRRAAAEAADTALVAIGGKAASIPLDDVGTKSKGEARGGGGSIELRKETDGDGSESEGVPGGAGGCGGCMRSCASRAESAANDGSGGGGGAPGATVDDGDEASFSEVSVEVSVVSDFCGAESEDVRGEFVNENTRPLNASAAAATAAAQNRARARTVGCTCTPDERPWKSDTYTLGSAMVRICASKPSKPTAARTVG